MTGPNSKRICMFEKFSFCKNNDCQYFHPSEICDETCDIRKCLKKHTHTQTCMFFTMFGKCKHGQNCKFRHEDLQQNENVIKDSKIDEIKKEYDLKLHEKEKHFSSLIADVKAENMKLREFCHRQTIINNDLCTDFEAVKKELKICIDYLMANDDPDVAPQTWYSFSRDARTVYVTRQDDDEDAELNEETQMITEDSTESKDLNVQDQKYTNEIDMEEEQNSPEDKNNIVQNNCAKTSKYQPKNDFHNLNYLTSETENIINKITKGKMTDKKVYECKQHIKNFRTKMYLKFKKNKESDKKVIKSFDKMCQKIESTKVRPLITFKKTATNELNEFLGICKKEILKCKK